jgi:cobalt/nickel transport system permease protein
MLPSWLGSSDDRGPCPFAGERLRGSFAERAVVAVADLVADEARTAADIAAGGGLKAIDARAKLVATALLLVAVSSTTSLAALAATAGLAAMLAALSRLHVRAFVRDVWLFVPLFSAAVALPALFRRFTPGAPLLELGPLAITRPGALAAARLVLRAGASVSLAVLLARTTGAPALLRALRSVGVPQAFTLVAAMTHRYIFVLAREVEEMHLGLLSRRLAPLGAAAGRAFVTSRMGVLLGKAHRTAEEVHLAMVARGFDGEWRTLAAPRLGARDVALVLAAAAVGALVLLAPRAGVP